MRLSIMILVFMLTLFTFKSIGQAKPHVSANNAILMDEISGRVLFNKSAYEQQPIASITKVMTAIIAIEQGELADEVKASRRAVFAEGSSIYLELEEKMRLDDLLYGLLLRSGNDAAIAIAEHIGGSVEGFVYLMNEKASQLGMTKTTFINPHGLHDDEHYSTAYDMALLLRYAMQNETFQTISSARFHKPISRSYGWKNKHRLVNGMYKHSTGGKTGFTKRSGRTLMTTAKKSDLSLIAVTLNAPDDWNDHINLFNWGFKSFHLEKLLSKGKVTYPLKDIDEMITGYINEDIYYPLRKSERTSIKQQSYLLRDNSEDDLIIGKTNITLNNELIAHIDIHNHSDNIKSRKSLYEIVLQISGIDYNG